jgi:hypothetical protein
MMLLGSHASLQGNDSQIEVAAGGIRPRKESRISLEKERLTVSIKKVTVEYEFLNLTSQDIVTEVGFPMPPYEYTEGNGWGGAWSFTDFRVWVDGREVHYQTESRAKVKEADYTDLLHHLGIDVQTFDHHDPLVVTDGLRIEEDTSKQRIEKLPKSTKENLARLGLIDPKYECPTWTVLRTYYWTQRFPARQIVKVRHEYTPVFGFGPFLPEELQSKLKDACIEPSLQEKLNTLWAKGPGRMGDWYVNASWVKYVLTTANNWKTPIKDFELIVERPEWTEKGSYFVSLCWDGKVRRSDERYFVAQEANFVPRHELAVYYLRPGPEGPPGFEEYLPNK